MKRAELLMQGWAGLSRHPIEILAETPQRYRVRMVERTPLPGRVLNAGDEALVPKRSVRVQEETR